MLSEIAKNLTEWRAIRNWLPVMADLAGMGLAVGLLPRLAELLTARNTWTGGMIAAAFILFALGVHTLKKLQSPGDGYAWAILRPWLSEERRRVLAFFFSLCLAWVMVEQSGFFRTITQVELGDSGLSYYLLLGPLWWVLLAFLYMFVFSFPTEPTLELPRHALRLWLALLASNGLMVVMMGYVAAAPYLNDISSRPQSLLLIPIFLLLFAPPRLLYLYHSQAHPIVLLPFIMLVGLLSVLVI
ncbi:MAG: hypothetical protein KJ063_08085 [Anaerolineae bacterium]|nr:hypothetical protein [Anaerolineae bacterium]